MVIVGKKNQKIVPYGVLEGPGGTIPISSFSGSFSVGSLPTCSVGVPIEILDQLANQQTDDIYRVKVGEKGKELYTMFKGYISGDNSQATGTHISAGLGLIHVARDLDQHRISAPNLHPCSPDDFTYIFRGDGNSANAANAGFLFRGTPYFDGKAGLLPQKILQGLIGNLEKSRSVRNGVGGGFKIETAEKAIALLKTIRFLNGTIRPEIAQELSGQQDNSINQFIASMAERSFTSKRSVWDTLVAIFSQFGLNLICDCAGNVIVSADMAGFKPAAGNLLDGDYIATHDKDSVFQRNIKEVNVIGSRLVYVKTTMGGGPGTIITWPENSRLPGASLAVQLPGWLTPLSLRVQGSSDEPPSAGNPGAGRNAQGITKDYSAILNIQRQYARMIYLLEKNKLRTMSVSGPLAPRVVPGTTAIIKPMSAVRPKSTAGLQEIKQAYVGYCYQINHVMDVDAKVLQTSFKFRNVAPAADNEIIDQHPIFTDVKPFDWI